MTAGMIDKLGDATCSCCWGYHGNVLKDKGEGGGGAQEDWELQCNMRFLRASACNLYAVVPCPMVQWLQVD